MKLSATMTGTLVFGTASIALGQQRPCYDQDFSIRSLDGSCNQLFGHSEMGAADSAFNFEMGQYFDTEGALYMFTKYRRNPSEPNNYAIDVSNHFPPGMVCRPETCEEIGGMKIISDVAPGMKGNPRKLSTALHNTQGIVKTDEEPGLSLLSTFTLQFLIHDVFGAIKRTGLELDKGGFPNMNDPNNPFVRSGIPLDKDDHFMSVVPGLANFEFPTIGVSGPIIADSTSTRSSGKSKMKFLNEKTSFADLDGIYGLGGEITECLREFSGGRLSLEDYEIEVDDRSGTPKVVRLTDLPPPTTCLSEATREEFRGEIHRSTEHITPLYGDFRNTENVAMGAVHLAFIRLHNQLTQSHFCSSLQGDEAKFQCARRLNIAIYQHIVFGELMEAIVGRNLNDEYQGYNDNMDASLMAEADICARFHFAVPNTLPLADEQCNLLTDYDSPPLRTMESLGDPPPGHIPLAGVRFNQNPMGSFPVIIGFPAIQTGHDPWHQLLRGLTCFNAPKYNEEVTNIIRNNPSPPSGVDVPAFTYARHQQLGIAPFLEVYEHMVGGKIYGGFDCPASYRDNDNIEDPLSCFTRITGDSVKSQRLLDGLREAGLVPKVKNIPLWSGIVYEQKTGGSHLGTTQTAVIVEQMRRIRDGDRFYYQNELNQNELSFIYQFDMNTVLRRAFGNDELRSLPRRVFEMNGALENEFAQQEYTKQEKELLNMNV